MMRKHWSKGWIRWTAALVAAVVLFPLSIRLAWPRGEKEVRNPLSVPLSMEEEGAGPQSPFWPSAARTTTGGLIPSSYFMDSKRCGDCHQEIYKQWQSSMHRWSSFNNRFYARSIEHMQEISGTRGSKWCAGCHDHAMLFSGMFERPVAEQMDKPEAHAGLGCVSCHSIVHVDSTAGNGGFTMEYPKLHAIAGSQNPMLRNAHDLFLKVEPSPHSRTFLKPFMRTSEFCSACHKVHLDEPVNHYRWLRGFNEYDNWQASGVSGQGARSFYYPEKPLECAGCHMPLVPSKDPAARDGKVHDHRFAAANTAVPAANGDETQLAAVRGFLQSGFITVDIFAAGPADTSHGASMVRRGAAEPQLMTTFAVGEEAAAGGGAVLLREVSKIAAPLDEIQPQLEPGSSIRLDVVVRTRKIGHFFPGGTVDAFDVWLELEGRDATGQPFFHSGRVEQDGSIDPGAHFYRSYMLDGSGNPINKRNAWQARSVLYVRLIPPGAADTVHYRVVIPKNVRGPVTFDARLNYRKFSKYYTEFSYALQPKPGQKAELVSLHYDAREYGPVPGARIPQVPIVTLAQARVTLPVAPPGGKTEWRYSADRRHWERWNDWGIGHLLQGDLKAAEFGFLRVTESRPDYADGWLNVARALIQEGEIDRAKLFVEKAMKLDSSLGRVWFFKAMAEKAEGDYDAALASLREVERRHPRDRVVQNQIGRILFLKRDFRGAVQALQKVLEIDTEDVQAHYNLMLAYKGLGEEENARRHERLFRRFKADESSQALTAKARMLSAEDNNERQPVHEHESAPLAGGRR